MKVLNGIIDFYLEGFRRMTVGRTLWRIIILKLFLMFAIIRLFFFPDWLQTRFPDDEQRARYVMERYLGADRDGPPTDKE